MGSAAGGTISLLTLRSPEEYDKACVTPAAGAPAGQVVAGVGTSACFNALNGPGGVNAFSATNAKYFILVQGDAGMEALKSVAIAFLNKLPS